jgi:hypothetical protein
MGAMNLNVFILLEYLVALTTLSPCSIGTGTLNFIFFTGSEREFSGIEGRVAGAHPSRTKVP